VDRVALLSAVWGICLYRYGARTPVVVGVPVAGRPHGRHATIAGLCTNTAPLAIPVDPAESPVDLVRQTREQLLAALEGGLYPLARAVEVLRPERVLGRMPLVETLVTIQESPLPEVADLMAALVTGDAVDLDGLCLRPVPTVRRSCRYDLDLVITPLPTGGYLLTLDYSADPFTEDTARRILRTYAAMVTAAVDPATHAVADLFVLADEDRAAYEVGGTASTPRLEARPDELLRRIATEHPTALAVVGTEGLAFRGFEDRIRDLSAVLAGALEGSRT